MIDVFSERNSYVLADYSTENIPVDCVGHPFIEALPIFLKKSEIINSLERIPFVSEGERQKSSEVRLNLLRKTPDVFVALPRDGILWGVLQREITSVYLGRFRNDPNHYRKLLNRITPICVGPDAYRPSFLMLTGDSGAGKTSSINRFLSKIPQVIKHQRFRDYPFMTKQIPWIKIDFPHNATTKPIVIEIIRQIYGLLGLELEDSVLAKLSRQNVGVLLDQVSSLFAVHGVALLVVDNTENIIRTKYDTQLQMLNFMFNLYEKTGVLVVFIGTNEIENVVGSELRTLRRSIEQNVPKWKALNDKEWERYVAKLWSVQYLKEPTLLTPELSLCLRQYSLGLPGIARPLFTLAQDEAIRRGDSNSRLEEITTEMIGRAVKGPLTQLYSQLGLTIPVGNHPQIVTNANSVSESTTLTASTSPKERHVRAALSCVESAQLEPILSNDERERAKSFLSRILQAPSSDSDVLDALNELGLSLPSTILE